MTTSQMLLVALLGFMGALSLGGAIFNWNWFMESRKAYWVSKLFGRTGARIFYAIIGLGLIAFVIYGSMHPELLHSRRYGI